MVAEDGTTRGSNVENAGDAAGQQAERGSGEFDQALSARDADFTQLEQAAADESSSSSTAELEKLRIELADAKDKYLRSIAEFENYKKRALRERSELLKYQGERIIADLLTVLDSIELALTHKDGDPQQLKQGLELIQKLFVDSLSRWEVRAVSGLGTKYDPNRFEALSRVESADSEPGTIINEAQKAYMYKDRLLRPGKVVVSIKPAEKTSESAS